MELPYKFRMLLAVELELILYICMYIRMPGRVQRRFRNK